MPGPSRTPKKILEARGSWLAKVRQGEPEPPVERPSCPAFLKGEAKREWNRQCVQLRRLGIIAKCDRAVLAAYCLAWEEFIEAEAWIAQHGHTTVTENGYVTTHPLVYVRNNAADRLLKLSDRFGFSPAARARVRTEKPPKDQGPQLDAFKIA